MAKDKGKCLRAGMRPLVPYVVVKCPNGPYMVGDRIFLEKDGDITSLDANVGIRAKDVSSVFKKISIKLDTKTLRDDIAFMEAEIAKSKKLLRSRKSGTLCFR